MAAMGRPLSSPLHPVPCKGCDAEIFLAITVPGGKIMLLDAKPCPEGNVAVRHDVTGNWLARVLRKGQEPDPRTEELYSPHWASCPKAAEHRKRRRNAAKPSRPAHRAAASQPGLF